MDPNDGLCGEAWAKKSSSSNAPGAKMTDYGLRFHQPFQDPQNNDNKQPPDWDPIAMLSNLSFLEQKIHQLQDMVHSITTRSNQDLVTQQQQQLVTTDLTSIIVQLISTAGSLLPSVKHHTNPTGQQFEQFNAAVKPRTVPDVPTDAHEDHEMKDEEDNEEILAPGSYEILQLEKDEILAPHTHFCTICGKGFKRDANLRMHMRGHGDEYKTPAALAKPASCSEPSAMVKRYSCPFAGCKRNKDHKKFQPLKTILCVKNHYKRTHCDKSYVCSRCNAKKFSVIADLKTHEKHCGRDKWLCSCGTTFSRKDKLFGHIALFQGHTPAIPPDCNGEAAANKAELGSMDFDCGTSGSGDAQALMDFKSDDPAAACFSPLNFDSFQEFNRQAFDDSDGSLSFLLSGSCNYNQKSGLDS